MILIVGCSSLLVRPTPIFCRRLACGNVSFDRTKPGYLLESNERVLWEIVEKSSVQMPQECSPSWP